ncbi:MAG: hypothetical protein RL595_2041 [Planctomycetota bacterium]|jgi:2-oxoglutarate ferredoxin oxidoreductase subunit alpha
MASEMKAENAAGLSLRIRLSGDARDGIAMLSHLFSLSALGMGCRVNCQTEHPAEIRSMPNTLAGVFSSTILVGSETQVEDDEYHLLLAMNPAALKLSADLASRKTILLINSDSFGHDELQCAGYSENPLQGILGKNPNLVCVPISQLTNRAINTNRAGEQGAILSYREVDRLRNLFTLGLLLQKMGLGPEPAFQWLKKRYKANASILDAATKALKAGILHAENALEFPASAIASGQVFPRGTQRRMILGLEAMVLGLRQLTQSLQRPVLLSLANRPSPIQVGPIATKYAGGGFSCHLAEDDASACAAALGVSYGGGLGCVSVAGVGFGHTSEMVSMAIAAEIPLLIFNMQRAGISLGLPQRMAQADLGMVIHGRNGESPLVCFSPKSPADVFETTLLAARLALRFLTPVCVLLDQWSAFGSASWEIPKITPEIEFSRFASDEKVSPYACDEMLARPWITPGTTGQEHRLGGNERRPGSAQVSFNPLDHAEMNRHREARLARMASWLGPAGLEGPNQGDLLAISWGGTFSPVHSAVLLAQKQGLRVSHLHLNWLNPLPVNLENLLAGFGTIVVAELNHGRLFSLLRERFRFHGESVTRQDGCNFQVQPLFRQICKLVMEKSHAE